MALERYESYRCFHSLTTGLFTQYQLLIGFRPDTKYPYSSLRHYTKFKRVEFAICKPTINQAIKRAHQYWLEDFPKEQQTILTLRRENTK